MKTLLTMGAAYLVALAGFVAVSLGVSGHIDPQTDLLSPMVISMIFLVTALS